MENRVRLDDLDASAQTVRQSVASTQQAFQFENGATRLKRNYQWEQYKTILLVGVVGLVLLAQTGVLASIMEDPLIDCPVDLEVFSTACQARFVTSR